MAVPSIDDSILLSFFLLGLSVCATSAISHKAKRQDRPYSKTPKKDRVLPQGKYYRLTCLLEDVPRTSLRGQAYHLATPLMTPFACPLEDAPQRVLKGQAYELATPLMTPFACIVPRNWREFYARQLGKPGIHYWHWKDKPESNQVCRELSLLLTLPEPKKYAKQVLESLAETKYLFYQSLQSAGEIGNLSIAFRDSIHDGKFAHLDYRVQKAMRKAFRQWHESAIEQIGVENLKAIYRVCYGKSWQTIHQLIAEDSSFLEDFIADDSVPWWKILGVSSDANAVQVEQAYKNLIRLWHPDLNKHPYATQVTSRINVAYERYQALHPVSWVSETIGSKNNANLFNKIREWLKPFIAR